MAIVITPQSAWYTGGQLAAGGSLYVYQTLTTTKVTIYSDAGLTTPITNPITLDANGQAKFYVGGSVDIRLDSYDASGGLIESLDPCFPAADLGGFTGTGTDLNKIAGVTNGTAAAGKALVTDSGNNIAELTSIALESGQLQNFGGFINKFRNPFMDFWSRGTGGTIASSAFKYSADGWIMGFGGATGSFNQASGFNFANYSLQITGASGVTDAFVAQRIESILCRQLYGTEAGGQIVTVQANIYNNTGASVTPTLTVQHCTAVDNWSSSVVDVNGVTLQTIANNAAQVCCYSFMTAAGSNNGIQVEWDFGAACNGVGKNILFTEADIRVTPGVAVGLNNNPQPIEEREVSTEYALNARYLPAFSPGIGAVGTGQATSATTADIYLPFNIPARIAPTGISATSANTFALQTSTGGSAAVSALVINSAQTNAQMGVVSAATSAGLTAGNATALIGTSSTCYILFTGAEL